MLVLGLMSGTSLDGIDCALTHISGHPPDSQVQLESFSSFPLTLSQRKRIELAGDPETGNVKEVNELNFMMGDWLATSALAALQVAGVKLENLSLIASHGQTIYHSVGKEARRPATLQIGDPSVIAHNTGVTTVGNFRTADVAAGGQGAPLVSYVDWLLWRHPSETRVILNIGGIANLTCLPIGQKAEETVAFDTGPGNMLIDFFARQVSGGEISFDEDGRLSASGLVDHAWLREMLDDPYFKALPPKTTGRERFGNTRGDQLWHDAELRRLSPEDRLATVTALTAHSIAGSVQDLLPSQPDRILVGGGGGHNKTLIGMLRSQLHPIPVSVLSGKDRTGDAKEALSFALLGYETIHGRPGNLPNCTGADSEVVLGQIAPGRNYRELMWNVHSRPLKMANSAPEA